MAKRGQQLTKSGQTTDGKDVLSGLYGFFETEGLPLDVLFMICMDNNVVPDWIDFYKSAKKAGMSHDRVVSKLDESISDSFGKDYAIHVIGILNQLK